jgi:hypothetical protein
VSGVKGILIAADPDERGASSASVWAKLLACILGAFLIGTAVLKVLSPAEVAAQQAAHELPRWIVVFAVEAELLVGVLLIAGVAPRPTWMAALCLFLAFAAFSLYRAAAGFESCGCFGIVKVNPWATFALDAAIISMLLRSLPLLSHHRQQTLAASPHRALMSLGCYIPLGGIALLWMTSTGAAVMDGAGISLGNDRLVILEPSEWPGMPFPLAEHLSPAVNVMHGEWIVLMYHHDCPECQEALPKYEELAVDGSMSRRGERVLLLELPPFGERRPQSAGSVVHARLSNEREWFVQAPVEICLKNGQVINASTELPSIDRLR